MVLLLLCKQDVFNDFKAFLKREAAVCVDKEKQNSVLADGNNEASKPKPSSKLLINQEKEMFEAEKHVSKQNSVCKYYRKGICRHGQSGNTAWNGMSCKFFHPRKCNKFCKYGYHPVLGCNDRYCTFMHPVLCQNSIDEQRCMFPNCSFQHLHGTVRPDRYGEERRTKYGPERSGGFPRNRYNVQKEHDVTYLNYRNNNFNNERRQFSAPTRYNRFSGQAQPQSFFFKNEDFPPLQTTFKENQYNESISTQNIMLTLKSIQQDIALLKQNRNSNDNNPVNENCNPQFNQDFSKNLINQPNRFGQ